MYKIPTQCCALMQMSANNEDSLLDLRTFVYRAKIESQKKWNPLILGGQRAIFCITVSPYENQLEYNLKQLGFNHVSNLNRRNGYPKGLLKMWLLSW